jgi:uncharacterized protein (TIGR00730 family)
MEAANKGAYRGIQRHKRAFPKDRPPVNVGLTIELPFEKEANPYVNLEVHFRYFFVRKVMFVKYAQGFIVLPGGYGTMDELFEALTLIQTKKIGRFPIVLVGKEYRAGLEDWLKETMLATEANINEEDLDLFSVVDTATEAVKVIDEFYSKYLLSPNF